MKKLKFMVLLLFIILAGGAVFYFGWIQIHLDKNTYGIAFTKSDGYLPKVYSPGKFSWSVYRLIPGNFTLSTFHIEPVTDSVTKEGTLPSGKIYGKYLPGQPDFTYRFSFTITYLLNAEMLPELLSKEYLTPQTYSSFMKRTSRAISSAVTELVVRRATDTENEDAAFFFKGTFQDSVRHMVQKQFYYLKLLTFTPVAFSFPDPLLYEKARHNYLTNLDSISRMETAARQKASETVVRESSKIELLKQYGELFKKYPELARLLADSASLRKEVLPDISLSKAKAP